MFQGEWDERQRRSKKHRVISEAHVPGNDGIKFCSVLCGGRNSVKLPKPMVFRQTERQRRIFSVPLTWMERFFAPPGLRMTHAFRSPLNATPPPIPIGMGGGVLVVISQALTPSGCTPDRCIRWGPPGAGRQSAAPGSRAAGRTSWPSPGRSRWPAAGRRTRGRRG